MRSLGDPRRWGVEAGYRDAAGHWRAVPAATVEAALSSMGSGAAGDHPPEAPVFVVPAGVTSTLEVRSDLRLEDGTELAGLTALPRDLPLGYHHLRADGEDAATTLVVSPGRCHLPESVRGWGWSVQLYAARSGASWGMGDLGDLRRLVTWSAGRGASVVVLNPLHATGPALPQQASPYYPTSRRWRSPLYLRVEEVPGADAGGGAEDLMRLAALGRALDDDRRIDRDRVWSLKREALAACHARAGVDRRFEDHRRAGGEALERWATWCAIADVHGNAWSRWPVGLRRPDGAGVTAFATSARSSVEFHAWLQWQLELQLGAVAGTGLVQDLAVGFDPDGFDAWCWQDLLALDQHIGAPPDEFNTSGQDWGLPPFVPWKLRAAGYRPLIETLRASMAPGGGVRIDHVMGLFRLFWVPAGASPAAGTYVRYPADELLAVLALESHRAGAFVVGEDLGTVEAGVREELARRRVLSTRLLWFEDTPPAGWPADSLAAITTHDLPTVAGLWTGTDLAAQRASGVAADEEGAGDLRRRLAGAAGVADDASVEEVAVGAHVALGGAACRLRTATLDDALGVTERPNMPGTVDTWPNWSLALPRPLEEIETDPVVQAVGQALGGG